MDQRTTLGKAPRRRSAEFKQEVVRRARTGMAQGSTMSSVARALGLNPSQLSKWIHDAISAGSAPAPAGDTEARELKRLPRPARRTSRSSWTRPPAPSSAGRSNRT